MTHPTQLDLTADELANFAQYCRIVASEAVGPARLSWTERAEWMATLAEPQLQGSD